MPQLDLQDKQGGKKFGELKDSQAKTLDEINQQVLGTDSYQSIENLEEKLQSFKAQFMEFDLDNSGDIDQMELKQMLEKLGQPKTHKEVMKMIREVDTTNSNTITYQEFLDMMLGLKKSVLRLILMFEGKAKDEEKPSSPPPKRDLASLP